MHDGMPCDPIQGQGHGNGTSVVPKIALSSLEESTVSPARDQFIMIYRLLQCLAGPVCVCRT